MAIARTARTAAWCSLVLGTLAEAFGQWLLLDFLIQEALNLHEVADVTLVDERDGHAVALGASRSSYTVYIVFRGVRHVEVDDDADVVDVDAA